MRLYVDYKVLIEQARDLYITLYSDVRYSEQQHAEFIIHYLDDFKRYTNVIIINEDEKIYEKLKEKAGIL